MSQDTKDDSSGGDLPVPAKLPPRELFKVAETEIEAVMLLPVPSHPDAVFDDDELRTLVANAHSLTIVEKVNIIVSSGRFVQQQVDKLLEILRAERKSFDALNEKHNKQLEDMELKHAAHLKQREGQPVDTNPTTSELAPGEKAGIVYKAIPGLLAPIGAGDGQKFFTAFLQRLAWQIEQGGSGVIEGELPAVFEPELRNSKLNKNPNDSKNDMKFINALVRPALSKLGHAPSQPMIFHKGSIFAVALVIEGPERPRGRVKQRHRIGVFVRLDSRETARGYLKRAFLRRVVERLTAGGQELVRLERLGPFGPIIRRVVERSGYETEEKRALQMFVVTAAVLGDILNALRNDERLPFLMHLLELPVRWNGAIPTEDFDNWFLNAVELNDGLTTDDESFDYNVGRFQTRLRYAPFDFPTQLLLLKAYQLAPGAQRMVLLAQLGLLDGGRVPGATAGVDTIYRPPETVDLQGMLAMNISDVADFLRLVEAQVLDFFTKE